MIVYPTIQTCANSDTCACFARAYRPEHDGVSLHTHTRQLSRRSGATAAERWKKAGTPHDRGGGGRTARYPSMTARNPTPSAATGVATCPTPYKDTRACEVESDAPHATGSDGAKRQAGLKGWARQDGYLAGGSMAAAVAIAINARGQDKAGCTICVLCHLPALV